MKSGDKDESDAPVLLLRVTFGATVLFNSEPILEISGFRPGIFYLLNFESWKMEKAYKFAHF